MTTSRRKVPPTFAKRKTFTHQFVEHLPDKLEDGVLYISIRYTTAAHNCFCGCGREVVTPLHPTKWKFGFDGVNVSLNPSVGSWSLNCKSHYWLEDGRVCWADTFNDEEIRAVRRRDQLDQQNYYVERSAQPADESVEFTPSASLSRWQQLRKWFGVK
jgi:hypothetical protein